MTALRTRILEDRVERRGGGSDERGYERSGASIRRMSVEIELDGRRELVSILEDERGVRAITTGGELEGPFIDAALEIFEAGRAKMAALSRRERRLSEAPARRDDEIAEAIRALVLAVARAGLGLGRVSPTVSHAFAGLEERILGRDALGIERFIGRLRNAIEFQDLTECAMLLHGALRFVDDLERGGEAARERIAGWIPTEVEPTTLNERGFIELGREWVAGLERAAIGRRYLVDLESGEIVREEFRAEEFQEGAGASLGGAFRELCAGLARLSSGSEPRRIHFDQYELWHEPREAAIERLDELAERSVRRLLEQFKAAHHRAPGQAEPFALFAPARIVRRGRALALLDEEGDALAISSAEGLELDTALAELLEAHLSFEEGQIAGQVRRGQVGEAGNEAASLEASSNETSQSVETALAEEERADTGSGVRWIAGRLFHAEGALVLRPFMVSLRRGEVARLR